MTTQPSLLDWQPPPQIFGMDYSKAHERFSLNVESGILSWKTRTGRAVIGAEAGWKAVNGYRYVMVEKRFYLVHRVIWLLTSGKWPEDQIDHINGIRDDNRPRNLREATRSENGKNQKLPCDNLSGIMGVDWDTSRKKWRAQIRSNGKGIHIGRFNSKEEAIAARKAAEAEHGFHPNHGRAA